MFKKNDQQTIVVNKNINNIARARYSILIIVLFTVINIAALAFNGGESYFLFSAIVPYFIALMGMMLTGKFPPEYYEDIEGFEPLPEGLLYGAFVVAGIILALFMLFFFLSKKNTKWLYGSLTFIVIDSLFLLMNLSIIDIVFHVWMIVEQVIALRAGKKLASEPEPIAADGAPLEPYQEPAESTPAQEYNLNGENDDNNLN